MKLAELLDDLSILDRQERIDYLISLANEFVNPSGEQVPRTEQTRVPGCESEVYMAAGPRIAVDNPQGVSAMALATILLSLDASEVNSLDESVVYQIFGNELSMGKSMGLTGMVRMAKRLS